jgi:predicted nucleic acid-binding protein
MSEVLVCDTSFLAHLWKQRRDPDRYESWGAPLLPRLRSAILAISIITVAESRAGFLIDGWGRRRVSAAEWTLGAFLQIPLGAADADEWARLRAGARARGVAISDNDLWIAATASVREHVLVTCDRDHLRLAPELPVEVVFLQPPV